jgi:hypothetical protein
MLDLLLTAAGELLIQTITIICTSNLQFHAPVPPTENQPIRLRRLENFGSSEGGTESEMVDGSDDKKIQ